MVIGLVVVLGCGEDERHSGPDAGPGADAGPVAQGSEASSDLAINEVAPRGDGPDWLELVNRSEQAIDLCGYFVTDSVDRLDHYQPLGGVLPPDGCEPRWLEPGEYLVVWADDGQGQGVDHAPFRLGQADEVHVVTTSGAVVDSLLYLHLGSPGPSLARQPDSQGLFYRVEPSQGMPNPEVYEVDR